jgi:hypothetical protein
MLDGARGATVAEDRPEQTARAARPPGGRAARRAQRRSFESGGRQVGGDQGTGDRSGAGHGAPADDATVDRGRRAARISPPPSRTSSVPIHRVRDRSLEPVVGNIVATVVTVAFEATVVVDCTGTVDPVAPTSVVVGPGGPTVVVQGHASHGRLPRRDRRRGRSPHARDADGGADDDHRQPCRDASPLPASAASSGAASTPVHSNSPDVNLPRSVVRLTRRINQSSRTCPPRCERAHRLAAAGSRSRSRCQASRAVVVGSSWESGASRVRADQPQLRRKKRWHSSSVSSRVTCDSAASISSSVSRVWTVMTSPCDT